MKKAPVPVLLAILLFLTTASGAFAAVKYHNLVTGWQLYTTYFEWNVEGVEYGYSIKHNVYTTGDFADAYFDYTRVYDGYSSDPSFTYYGVYWLIDHADGVNQYYFYDLRCDAVDSHDEQFATQKWVDVEPNHEPYVKLYTFQADVPCPTEPTGIVFDIVMFLHPDS